jgi:hypothetical protein
MQDNFPILDDLATPGVILKLHFEVGFNHAGSSVSWIVIADLRIVP